MTIQRADKSQHTYKRVCMDFANDTRLSWEARGVMAYLLSKSDDWRIIAANLINQAKAGRDKVYAILDELQQAGYLTRVYQRDERGRVQQVEYRLSEISLLTENTEVELLTGLPLTVNTEVGRTSLQLPCLPFTAQPFTANPTLPKEEIIPNGDHDLRECESIAPAALTQPEQLAIAIGQSEPDQPEQPVRPARTPTPSSDAPPSPKPRRPKPDAVPPEVAAIRQALKDAAEWGPSAKANAQAKAAGDKLIEFDPAVTPEQIAVFRREWFPRFSPVAVAVARRGDPLNAPTPEQVLQYWPSFQPWWAARQSEIARRAEAEKRRRERPDDDFVPGDPNKWNPFRNRYSRPITVATD